MPTLRLPAPPCGAPPHHPRLGIVPGSAYRPPAPHWVPGTVHRVGPQIVAHCIGVRLGPRYEMLKAVRTAMAAALGQCPAILATQIRDQPQHRRTGIAQWLTPGKPRRDPAKNLI